jgi:hypothetical protein
MEPPTSLWGVAFSSQPAPHLIRFELLALTEDQMLRSKKGADGARAVM